MRPISRRMFLAGSAAVVVAACSDDGNSDGTTPATGGTSSDTSPGTGVDTTPPTEAPTTTAAPEFDLPTDPFTLGVASGDPDPTGVVLWTRLALDPLQGGGMPDGTLTVTWQLSTDADFGNIPFSGAAEASPEHGHSVHVHVALDDDEWWYYRFQVGAYTSAVGRTRRAPAGPTTQAVFASASCQNYANGYYAAHRDLAAQQPDFVLWLGDYIYEGAEPAGADPSQRVHLGPEPTTLEDYRNRYARYKSDADLQAAHAACPWFVIWDDHEVENNYAGLTPQDDADASGFAARRAAAYQAWWEHQPTRLDPPGDSGEFRIYRSAAWGDLLSIALLDGRQYRTDQACGDPALSLDPPCPETTDAARTMLGDEQEQWLYDTLDASTAVWNVIGNQVVLADATFNGAVLNYDQWDGYPVQRARILQHLADEAIPNVVVVTGDIHLAAVANLRAGDRGTGTAVGVEFVTTSISSDGLIGNELTDVLKSFPDLVDAELAHRGYTLHTVTPETWTADYRIVADVADAASDVTTFSTYVVAAGSNTVTTG